MMEAKAKVFIAYAREDGTLKDQLIKHLNVPNMADLLEVWHDREIEPGKEWEIDIHENLERADLVLMLISVDSLNSRYFLQKELKKILERHRTLKCIAIPVILRACNWQDSDLAELQVLPEDGEPVATSGDQDKAFSDIAAKVRERALAITEERNKKIRELELELEKHLRDDQRSEAVEVLGKLANLLEQFGDSSRKIKSYEQRVAELGKIQHLRDYLKKLEEIETRKNWEAVKSLLNQGEASFTPEEIETSKKADLVKSLLSNIEKTSERIRNKSEAASLDARAEKAFVRKDYEEAKEIWEKANTLENTPERSNRIRQCEERIGVRKKVADFEAILEQVKKIRDNDPTKARELLENAIQMVSDENLEASEEGERVKERLKAAKQELEEIKSRMEINRYDDLLKKAYKAFDDELYEVALNHFLVALETNPEATELEEKIDVCRQKLKVQQLRKAAQDCKGKGDLIGARGMLIALLDISPEDETAKKEVEVIDQILKTKDKDYAQAMAQGEKFFLEKAYGEAIEQFDRCLTIKPGDPYASARKADAQKRLEEQQKTEEARKHFNAGKDAFKKGQFWDARKRLSKASDFAPDNEEIKQLLKHASHMLAVKILFALRWFGWAKQFHQKLPPEIQKMEIVERLIAQGEERQKNWSKNAMRYAIWLFLFLLLILTVWGACRWNAARRAEQFNQAILRADASIQAGNYPEAIDICNKAIEKARNGQDSSRVQSRSQAAKTLLAAAGLEKQANETEASAEAISLQDSAVAQVEALQQAFEKTSGDTTLNPLKTFLEKRLEQMKERLEDFRKSQELEPLKEIIKKANASFDSKKDYKQALLIYEQAGSGKYPIRLLPKDERAKVRQNLEIIQSYFSGQANGLNSSISQKQGELTKAESYTFPPKKKVERLKSELAALSRTKSNYEALATRAGNLIDRFR